MLTLTMTWIFLLANFLMLDALHISGPNVCARVERNESQVTVLKPVTRPFEKRPWCYSKISNWMRLCPKEVLNITVVDNVTETRVVEECCPGYALMPKSNTCEPICSKPCVEGVCVAPNVCECRPNFGGPTCACPPNLWGKDCQNQCQCRNGAQCDAHDGKCTCKQGWKGLLCDEKCVTDNCAEECGCQNGGSCNLNTGNCSCTPGWMGTKCISKCAAGTFGESCSKRCDCIMGRCHHITGKCNCFPGFKGEKCLEKCAAGYYGVDCINKCYCYNSARCDRINGRCLCLAGWGGPKCENRVCPVGSYGPQCDSVCKCHPGEMRTKECHPDTGKCVCHAGWSGESCDDPCSFHKFGENCANVCQCGDEIPCSPINGTCHSYPPTDEDEPDNYRMYGLKASIGGLGAVLVLMVCSIGFYYCRYRRTGETRTQAKNEKLPNYKNGVNSKEYENNIYCEMSRNLTSVNGPIVFSFNEEVAYGDNHGVEHPYEEISAPSEDGYDHLDPRREN